MKVKKLIELLKKEPGESNVKISISQYNKPYPVAYCNIEEGDAPVNTVDQFKETRIRIFLPETEDNYMGTVTRKK